MNGPGGTRQYGGSRRVFPPPVTSARLEPVAPGVQPPRDARGPRGRFSRIFPAVARREGLLVLGSLLLSGAAGYFLVRGALSTRGLLRFLAIVGVFVSLALCLLNSWQLV